MKEVSHLATEGAGILGMLANLNLLHHFPKGRTVTGTIFTHNTNLLGALSLLGGKPEQASALLRSPSPRLLPSPDTTAKRSPLKSGAAADQRLSLTL